MKNTKQPDAVMMTAAAALVRQYRLPGWETTADTLDRMAGHLTGRTAPGGQVITEQQARAAGLLGYAPSIAVAIGSTDAQLVKQVEELMRVEYRTLDHLDMDRFAALARECLIELQALSGLPGRS